MNPERERARLVSLERLALVNEGVDSDFLELVQAAVCGTPVAAVGFLGAERHVLRVVVGADVRSILRAEALCEVPIDSGVALIVSDQLSDEVLRTHPTTVGRLVVWAYAGVPVMDDERVAVGTLCVIDSRPRPLTLLQMQTLTTLAHQVTTLLRLRRRDSDLRRLTEVLRASFDHSPSGSPSWRSTTTVRGCWAPSTRRTPASWDSRRRSSQT